MSKPKWFDAQLALETIKDKDWSWLNNSRCKYISLRIDTRDGACLIYDRNGNQISLDDLAYQYGENDE